MKISSGPRLVLFAVAALAAACNSDDPAAPSTPGTTLPAAPAPSPSPTVAAFRCPLPDMPRLNIQCPRPEPILWREVEAAIVRTEQEHPELFNFNDDKGGGSY